MIYLTHQEASLCLRFKMIIYSPRSLRSFTGSVEFRTTEKCGGQIEVKHRNQWEKVCLLAFPPEQREKLCRDIGCPGHNASLAAPEEAELVNRLMSLITSVYYLIELVASCQALILKHTC